MSLLHAILLGIIEGITEFLPVSSTGHLTIAEKFLGYSITDPDITAFTAVIQAGAILATLLYFRSDILRIGKAFLRGLFNAKLRNNHDYRFGWGIILGSVPIAVVGLAFQHQIETNLRSLWLVAWALIGWSGVMWIAERYGKQTKHEKDVTWKQSVIIGLAQCIALIPGVSRSGATISAGLLQGLDRVTATRMAFFLSIPALLAAGALEVATKAGDITNGVGWTATITGAVVSFVVAYFAVSWLLKFIAHHTFNVFIVYRISLGIVLIALLGSGLL